MRTRDYQRHVVSDFLAVYSEDMPISVNHLYAKGMRGEPVLSAAGKKFREGVQRVCAQATMTVDNPGGWMKALEEIFERRGAVSLSLHIYFPELFNKSWKPGRKTKTGNMTIPFIHQDASNYIKIIEDGVKLGTGIDDACHFWLEVEKNYDNENPRVEIYYSVYALEYP